MNNLFCTVVVGTLLSACSGVALANDGYQAVGHCTFTSLDRAGNPMFKAVMVFQVKVVNSQWYIRTEPLFEGQSAVGFNEVFHVTNGYVLSVVALESGYERSKSPFGNLLDDLKKSKKDDVLPPNPAFTMATTMSNAELHPHPMLKSKSLLGNNATANVYLGDYPPADASYASFLWFAFTPPNERSDGTNRMLLQIWDDANIGRNRFWRATWRLLPAPPGLIAEAEYIWMGKELRPDGTLSAISMSGLNNPLGMAARFEVESVTNLWDMMLPLEFKLTRYSTTPNNSEAPRKLSTLAATVVKVAKIPTSERVEALLPDKTFVTDYRFNAGALGAPEKRYYFEKAGPFPSVAQTDSLSPYKRTVSVPSSRRLARWILLVGLIGLPVFLFISCRRRFRFCKARNTKT